MTNKFMVNLYAICFFFLPIYFSIIEPLSPSTARISRRRRLHRLQSTHTRPLSRRNTAGRIIMYSISLRGFSLAPLPLPIFPLSLVLLSLSCMGGRGAGKKKKHGECRDEGSPRRFPRRKTMERETRGEGGVSLTPLKHDTRIHSLLDPTPSPLLILRGFSRGRKGEERLYAVSSTRRSPASELCERVRERSERSRGRGGEGKGARDPDEVREFCFFAQGQNRTSPARMLCDID